MNDENKTNMTLLIIDDFLSNEQELIENLYYYEI